MALLFTAAFGCIDSRGHYCPLLSIAVATAIVCTYVRDVNLHSSSLCEFKFFEI